MRLPSYVAAKINIALLTVLMILLSLGVGYCGEITDSAMEYDAILKIVKGGDTSVDYAKLRLSYTKTTGYNPYISNNDDREAMWEALNSSNFESALKHAQAILDNNFVDLDAHFISRIAYRELGNTERSEFHKTVLKGLMASLYDSGTGKTPETAIVVISTKEEYSLFGMNNLKVIKQKTFDNEGIHFDEMEVENKKTGGIMKMYFNVDIPFKWLSAKLSDKTK